MSWYRWSGTDLELSVRVQPRAPKDAWQGPDPGGEHYRVRIKAPPVDGKGNEALRRFVADAFGVAPSKVEILGGEHARYKRLRIQDPRAFPIPVGRD
ncbi:DUF167 domain-containing protein [Thiocystis violacea]|uniref:DUF167 domain-containing protein n=1 Tax=Thiocystis violacea TaxID=13725 RepID=UPI001903658E|nr:DUF167 domain-containing protein [Thiocystis violacea]MBK1724383.1 hypothetical protein [Thiocystis violacea]